MRALFDVNVLIALHDSDHAHHHAASCWLQAHIQHGWASCPLTQNGCLRIMAQPGYSQPQPLGALLAMLARSTSAPYHAFWPDDASLLSADSLRWRSILGSRQITDAYLLLLAVRNGGRFVTFDRAVPLAAVAGATADHLVVL